MKIPSILALTTFCVCFCLGTVLSLKWVLTGTVMLSSTTDSNGIYVFLLIFAFMVGVGFTAGLVDYHNKRKQI